MNGTGSFEVKVASGAAMLDHVKTGWFREVNPALINSVDGEDSVLGQLYGSYWVGVDELRLSTPSEYDYGFRADDVQAIDRIIEAWKSEIKVRASRTRTGRTKKTKVA